MRVTIEAKGRSATITGKKAVAFLIVNEIFAWTGVIATVVTIVGFVTGFFHGGR